MGKADGKQGDTCTLWLTVGGKYIGAPIYSNKITEGKAVLGLMAKDGFSEGVAFQTKLGTVFFFKR